MVRIHGRKYADIEAVAIFDAGTRESRIWPAFFPNPVAVRSTLSSECLGQFWRAEVGQFWKAPKVVSEDSARRALKGMDEKRSGEWLRKHLKARYEPLLDEPWALDMD